MTTRNAQLSLIETPRSWQLDNHTREVGRQGIAQARAALRAGRHARTQDSPAPPTRAPLRPRAARPAGGKGKGAGPRAAAA